MNTKKIFLMSALALLACGCQDDEGTSIQPTPGKEVKFGGMLDESALTRTIYGEEANGAYPIYWENGDQVLIASPECANNGGVGQATYAISVQGNQQNYASSMDKTGEIGVRWGDNETATFYSIYPAARHTSFNQNLSSARFTVTTQQDNTWDPQTNEVQPYMDACFMWAKTENVPADTEVNLAYKPLSTAVRIPLMGPDNTGSGEPVTISWIRLYAPEGTQLSGQFDVDFTQIGADGMPKVTAVQNTNSINYASMNAASTTGSYLTLGVGETATVQLFFMLEEDMEVNSNWSVRIGTADGRVFRKNLGDANGQILKRGQIHNLPLMPALSENSAWDPSNWMENIQRNVYLSEISIPGSWNSLNRNIQGDNPSITEQYNAGVRAFHLDTRWIARDDGRLIPDWVLTGDLGIANGGTTHDFSGIIGGIFEDQNAMVEGTCPTFAEALTEIANNVAGKPEYMVVYCTFAQGSYDPDGYDWRTKIAEACAAIDNVIDANELTANSTIADVLGHVIVIVSTHTGGEVRSKPFFTNLQNNLDQAEFTGNDYLQRDLTYNNSEASDIDLYATYAQVTASGNTGTNSDDRGYAPTLSERQQKINNILNWSQSNYAKGEFLHNVWMFMGLGGYVDDGEDYAAVNNSLIPVIDGRLSTMETEGAYYPVGIVFMNDVVNARNDNVNITQTVRDILLLNNRYRKAYDPDRSPVDGSDITGGSSTNTTQSAAPGYSSGMTDNGANAIGWSRID